MTGNVAPRPVALILPGLDGTGLLLDEFVAALSPFCRAVVVKYPTDERLGYEALTEKVMAQVPDGPWIAVGESFSGPIAIRLAQSATEGLVGVVLCASFARLDLPFRRLLAWLATVLPFARVPSRLLAVMLLGKWARRDRIYALKVALSSVPPKTLAFRAHAALTVDGTATSAQSATPVLYLQGLRDRLIPPSAVAAVSEIFADVTVAGINAPHFVLQTAPVESAVAIGQWLDGLMACQE